MGPLLFIIFINDLPAFINFSKVLLFEDDAKFYCVIHDFLSAILLQLDLFSFGEWCLRNSMKLNVSKCMVVGYTNVWHPVIFHYQLFNATLNTSNVMKDLGVTFSSSGNVSLHIDDIVNKAFRVLGYINLTFPFLRPYTYKTLYSTCAAHSRMPSRYGVPIL